MGSIIGHKIDYNGAGVLRGHRHIPMQQKLPQSRTQSPQALWSAGRRLVRGDGLLTKEPVDSGFGIEIDPNNAPHPLPPGLVLNTRSDTKINTTHPPSKVTSRSVLVTGYNSTSHKTRFASAFCNNRLI